MKLMFSAESPAKASEPTEAPDTILPESNQAVGPACTPVATNVPPCRISMAPVRVARVPVKRARPCLIEMTDVPAMLTLPLKVTSPPV